MLRAMRRRSPLPALSIQIVFCSHSALIVPCAENNSLAIFACQTACHCPADNLARKSAKMAGKMVAKNEAKPAARPLGSTQNIRKRGAREARAPFSDVFAPAKWSGGWFGFILGSHFACHICKFPCQIVCQAVAGRLAGKNGK